MGERSDAEEEQTPSPLEAESEEMATINSIGQESARRLRLEPHIAERLPCVYGWESPTRWFRIARATASVRVLTPSLVSMLLTWNLVVEELMTSC